MSTKSSRRRRRTPWDSRAREFTTVSVPSFPTPTTTHSCRLCFTTHHRRGYTCLRHTNHLLWHKAYFHIYRYLLIYSLFDSNSIIMDPASLIPLHTAFNLIILRVMSIPLGPNMIIRIQGAIHNSLKIFAVLIESKSENRTFFFLVRQILGHSLSPSWCDKDPSNSPQLFGEIF